MTQPLTPPPEINHTKPGRLNDGRAFPRIWVVLLFAMLGIAMAAVFVVLPGMVNTDTRASTRGPTGIDTAETEPVSVPVADRTDDTARTRTETPPAPTVKQPESRPAPKAIPPSPVKPEPEPKPSSKEGPVFVVESEPEPEPRADPFVDTLSVAMNLLEKKDYKAAGIEFKKAERLKPGTPMVAEGLAAVDRAENLARIKGLRDVAASQEKKENWRGAEKTYGIILTIDDTVAFAFEGRDRSRQWAELHEAVDYHLANPARLASPAVLTEARAIQRRAEAGTGPKIREKAETLGTLLTSWNTPVPVVLNSDGLTEILVYKVGRMGAFTSKSLDLKPGTYVVTGSRKGYRDVREELVVKPGRPPDALTVVCKEKI
ncbi:MAG: hypothetical protein QNK37_30020 [Acidobacteriota bacterium]|nr:hypothetical protein [Acidobacteriota bacterium]